MRSACLHDSARTGAHLSWTGRGATALAAVLLFAACGDDRGHVGADDASVPSADDGAVLDGGSTADVGVDPDGGPRIKIAWRVHGTSPLGEPASCQSLGFGATSLHVSGAESETWNVNFVDTSTCTGASETLIDMPIQNFHEQYDEVALGKYRYSVGFLGSFSDDRSIVSKGGTFELGTTDVNIDVEFVFHTLPVNWTISSSGVPKTCAEVGATRVALQYTWGRTTASTSAGCGTKLPLRLWPLEAGSYDVKADLLDAKGQVLATWKTTEPRAIVDSDTNGAPLNIAFAL